ncbi:MAG: hypothetical protein EON94_13025 [Caulobacteraceae bacterium]|nr:MAG: hypothetical protein EON94_13025 [Caulobacteraceae bacterium]
MRIDHMKTSTRFLITTGFASLMGLTLLAPSAYAQDMGAPKDAPPMAQPDDTGGRSFQFGRNGDNPGEQRGGRPEGRGGIAGMICSTDGATQLETRLADLATELKLTTEQQPLFDAYKTAALSAQTSFADTCPQPKAVAGNPGTPPDAVTMLKDRQARATAELDAITAVLPSFEALYNSLDDTQKAGLMALVGPGHGPHHGPRGDDRGDDDRGGDRHGRDDRGDDNRGGERGRGWDDGDRD